MNKAKIRRMAGIALLMALVIVLQFVGGMIPPVGGFSISLVLIPIVLGAAVFGPKAGALLGAAFGTVVTINCITGADVGGAMVFQASPILCILVVMGKGILAGFLSILSENFTRQWPERIINVHPSLIPSFCGKGFYGLRVHEEALAYGVKVTGATVHFVNEIPDGGKIIMQKAVYIEEDDTPEILQRRVMEQAEWEILPAAVESVSKQLCS